MLSADESGSDETLLAAHGLYGLAGATVDRIDKVIACVPAMLDADAEARRERVREAERLAAELRAQTQLPHGDCLARI